MTIGLRAQKTLWGRAAGRCSIPECRQVLFEDDNEAPDPTLIGENCHIVAESDGGPRADPSVSIDRRSSYLNLILFCRNHHKIIDDQESTYTVDILRKIKSQHEAWVVTQLGIDLDRQRDDEVYMGYVEIWQKKMQLNGWTAWTSCLLSFGQPSINVVALNNLTEICGWLISRVWPMRYTRLEAAFTNFGIVARDLRQLFLEHAEEKHGGGELITRKFYQIDDWNDQLYQKLSRSYDFHVDLVEDLTLELTRAANLICDEIRRCLLRSFRLKEGKLMVRSGPYDNFTWYEFTTEYSNEESQAPKPYPGLHDFMTQRHMRDRNFGAGQSSE